jgi:hypothetical protein
MFLFIYSPPFLYVKTSKELRQTSQTKSTSVWNRFLGRLQALLLLLAVFGINSTLEAQTTYTVTNTNDSGVGSLRQAITNANANLGADIINFNIGAGGLQTIAPLSALPTISEAVTINATTQTGYAGIPLIEIDGTSAGVGVTCFTVTGGNTTIKGFIINRFTGNGITLVTGNGNTVAGNYIGTNATATATLGAMLENIQVRSANNIIGGATTADRNIIGGGTEGMRIYGATATGNQVFGNRIGTGITGTEVFSISDDGIDIGTSAANNIIGGTTSNLANIICNASGDGIEFRSDGGTGNVILGNSIYSSGGNGIDFNQDGITANDVNDGDTGPNALQNYPVLTSASSAAAGTTIVGSLNSTASTNFRIEFFSNNPAIADVNGEGQVYLGFVDVTTNVSNTATINTTIPSVWVSPGDKISATATVKVTGTTFSNTSEFSANVTATSSIAPGGVSTNNTLWLKADAGTTTGATFTWADYSSSSRNATQSTAGKQPIISAASMNYNPAVTFDGVDDVLNISNSAGLPSGAAQVHGFGVARNLNTAGQYNTVFSYGISSTNSVFSLNKYVFNANAYLATNSADVLSSANEFANNSTVLFDGKYTGTQGILSSFGKQQATTSFVHNLTSANATVGAWLGGIDAWWNGNISEVILYSTNLTALEAQRVNSYLALKYGITLDQTTAQNYLASDGTTIFWNGTTNSGYKNNVAGIARDDASGLSQKQSKSANTGLQVAMGNGNTISTDNISNTNSFSVDKSALTWGDNAGSVAAWTTTGAPTSRRILARTWKVQETGTVGSVKVQIADNSGANGLPIESNTVYLLTDADGNFAAGATEITMTLNGTNWEANVDLTNGQFFTFATQPITSPGGVVSNDFLWLKADAGVTTSGSNVTQWADAGNYGVTGTAFNNPILYTNNHNFNPAVTFNGTNAYIDLPDGFANFTAGVSGFVIGRPTASLNYARFFDFGNGPFDNNLNLRRIATTNDYSYESVNGSTGSNTTVANKIVNNEVNEYGFVHAGTTATLYKNGENLGSGSAQNLVNITRINNYVARSNWAGDDYYQGDMAEIILFNKNVTNTERQKVESYLAIKYGKTLEQSTPMDYLASDASIFWNGTTNSSYKNNIAGIARDDASALNQKQSKSVNTGLQVAIGHGNTIATDNISNTNNFTADKTAFVWGDNGASVSAWTSVGAPTNRVILPRVWKVQKTGTTSLMKFQIPDNSVINGLPAEATAIYLLIDADGDFSSGASSAMMSLVGSNWECGANFSSGYYFTFATEQNANAGTFATISSCIDIKSTIAPTHNNNHNATNTQSYVLCNAQGIIMQVNTTPSFSTCGIGDFTVYAVNYPTNGVTNLTVGTDITALTGSPTNYDIEPLGITVCKTICGKYDSITPQ